jgi:hypothetical protein
MKAHDRTFFLFMYVNIANQLEAWGWGIYGFFEQESKHRFKVAMTANKNLISHIERELCSNPELLERFRSDSENISKVFELLMKSEKKQELFYLMQDYIHGNVRIEDDSEFTDFSL